MIYLKFLNAHNSLPTAAVFDKPSVTDIVKEAIGEYYCESIATRYSKSIGDFIYDKMEFPKDGIYCVVDDILRCYDSEKDEWIDTGMKESDYVIDENSKIWECFNDEFSYLADVSDSIKSAIKRFTEKLFVTENWLQIVGIEITTYDVHKPGTINLSKIVGNYFSESNIEKVTNTITKTIFGNNDQIPLLILENGAVKTGLLPGTILKVNESDFEKVKSEFSKRLESTDLNDFIARTKNMLCYGVDFKGEVIKKQGDCAFVKYKEHEALVDADGECFISTKNIKSKIISAIDNSKIEGGCLNAVVDIGNGINILLEDPSKGGNRLKIRGKATENAKVMAYDALILFRDSKYFSVPDVLDHEEKIKIPSYVSIVI